MAKGKKKAVRSKKDRRPKRTPENITRSYKLRLVIPRGSSDLMDGPGDGDVAACQALDATYRSVALATQRWKINLLQLRQDTVRYRRTRRDRLVTVESSWWSTKLLQQVKTASPLQMAQLQELYRAVIPTFDVEHSSVGAVPPPAETTPEEDAEGGAAGATSTAQTGVSVSDKQKRDALGWIGTLSRAGSRGGQRAFDGLDTLSWIVTADLQDPAVLARLDRQLVDNPELLKSGGKTASWVKKRREEQGVPIAQATWPAMLVRTTGLKQESLAGSKGIAVRLAPTGLLPPFSPQYPNDPAWDREAFGLAASHLIGWESWRHRMAAERAVMVREIDKALDNAPDDTALDLLERYEEERRRPLGEREIRGWSRIRRWLLKNPQATPKARANYVRGRFRLDRKNYGSEATLLWLADPARQYLVDYPGADPVKWLAEENRREARLVCASLEPLPAFTLESDPGIDLDCIANTNLPQYRFEVDADGQLWAAVDVLPYYVEGVKRSEVRLRVAKTKQLEQMVLGTVGKHQTVGSLSQDRLTWVVRELRGAKLKRHGGGYLLIVSTQQGVDTEALRYRMAAARYLQRGSDERTEWLGKTDPKGNPNVVPALVGAGLRVLAINLGLRHALGCSIFVLLTPGTHSHPVWDVVQGLDVVHERSFLLNLDGEVPTPDDLERRRQARSDLAQVRRVVGNVSGLCRYRAASTAEQRAEIHEWLRMRVVGLPGPTDAPPSEWQPEIDSLFYRYEDDASREMKWLRRQTYTDPRRPWLRVGGESVWRIEYLEDLRRLVVAWADHARPGKPMRRARFSERGTVARRLLDHLARAKDDRIKKTADLVVQAARGLAYRDGEWHKSFPPADIIVLDDLTKYRFAKILPPSENTRLMQWCHRSVAHAAENQSVEASIACTDTPTLYSSQFHARTGAPGVRCHALVEADVVALRGKGFCWLAAPLEDAGITPQEIAGLQAGMLVPVEGGELLATLNRKGALITLHTDIVAAQNNALRFLQGHSVEFRRWNQQTSRVEFCDPSGIFFTSGVWIEQDDYWKAVNRKVLAELRKSWQTLDAGRRAA